LRIQLRKDYNINIGIQVNDFKDLIKGKAGGLFKKDPGAFIIFGIILVIFSIVIFIVFLSNLCCCKEANSSSSKINVCLVFNIVFYVIFVVFIILTLVYSIKTQDSQNMLQCEIVKMPRNLIYGVNSVSNYFIGLNPLDDLLSKLKTEVSNISTVKSNFDNIINLNLP